MHLGVFSSLLLMAPTTGVLRQTMRSGMLPARSVSPSLRSVSSGRCHCSCSPSRYVSGSAKQSI